MIKPTKESEYKLLNAIMELENLKAEENKIRKTRIEAEEILGKLVNNEKLEGASSLSVTDNDSIITVTVTNKVSRKCDLNLLELISQNFDESMKLVKTKKEFNLTGYRKLMKSEELDKEITQKINELITVTPMKPAVTIKYKEV